MDRVYDYEYFENICLDDAKIKAEEFLDNIESSLSSFKK